MSEDDTLAEVIVEAVKRHALGPDWRQAATAHPLNAYGGHNEPDDWYGSDNVHGKRRTGHPCITVRNDREWAATVITTPTGKNVAVYVPAGTTVIEVN